MRALRTGWAVVAAALAVWLAVALISAAASASHYRTAERKADARTHFYRVISGDAKPGVAVSDALAEDLRAWPKGKLRLFQGTANRYGGVTAEIGADPFDNSCGSECGYLRQPILRDVQDARDGHPPTAHATRTAVSARTPSVLLLLWVIVGGVAAVAALIVPRLRRRRQHDALRRAYPDECRILDRIDRALAALPPGQRRQARDLRVTRDQIESGLRRRLDPNAVEDQITAARLDRLMADARSTLTAVEAGNKALGE